MKKLITYLIILLTGSSSIVLGVFLTYIWRESSLGLIGVFLLTIGILFYRIAIDFRGVR